MSRTPRVEGTPPRRTACVDVPALPLQLLLGRHPEWKDEPVVVVAQDRPNAAILWGNEAARRCRVLPGMRYAAGLSLVADLRAGTVEREEIAQTVAAVGVRLRRFTPRVEPAEEEPGVFWLDASGLSRTWPSLLDWAQAIRRDLAKAGLRAAAVVGFTRFGVYAVARASRRLVVFDDLAEEAAALRRVPLSRLGIDPEVRDTLTKLGVTGVGSLLCLPSVGIAARFGEATARLHRLAHGDLVEPMRPQVPHEPVRRSVQLEHGETDATRLLFVVKGLVDSLLAEVASAGEALVELAIELVLDGGLRRSETVRPAAATLSAAQVLDLVHLRFQAIEREDPLRRGVVEMALVARGVRASAEQLHLFAERPRRDCSAADRAFARLRTEFGEDAVVTARLADEHLFERSFTWEPLPHMEPAAPRVVPRATRPFVRRILTEPLLLPSVSRRDPDGWMLRGLEYGPVVRLEGPFVVSTAWWSDAPVHREYHLAETGRGFLSTVFLDVPSGRWFLQAEVE